VEVHVAEDQPKNARQGRVLGWLNPNGPRRWGTSPDDFSEAAAVETVRRAGALFGEGRYFGVDMQGWEHLPTSPVLFVANHSGGTTIPDMWGLMVGWYTRFPKGRPLHALAHEMVLATEVTGAYFSERGCVSANREQGLAVLAEWKRDLLVMPGGDLDTWRPWKDRYKVQFAGRKGYAWLALKAGVPIVPIAHAGAHSTLVVLSDGQKIAKAFKLPELFRASIWPVHLSLPWGLAVGPLPHLPLPAHLRYRFGPPIAPTEVVAPGEDPSPEAILALDEAVRAQMQRQLDALREESSRVSRLARLASRARRGA